jgi:hypothetical protein
MSDTDKTDKTGDKLVASIRKTRAGAAKKTATRKATTGGTAAAAARKLPAKKQATPRAVAKAGEKAARMPESTDAYQYGRRIWPD